MPGLLTSQQYTSRPAATRLYRQTALLTACAKRLRVHTLQPRCRVQPRKLLRLICSAMETGSVDPAAKTFMAVVGKSSAFEGVEPATLKQLQNQGQEETLPAGFKIAEEGLAPSACYVLLQSCFLRSNGEGDTSCKPKAQPYTKCKTHILIHEFFSLTFVKARAKSHSGTTRLRSMHFGKMSSLACT